MTLIQRIAAAALVFAFIAALVEIVREEQDRSRELQAICRQELHGVTASDTLRIYRLQPACQP